MIVTELNRWSQRLDSLRMKQGTQSHSLIALFVCFLGVTVKARQVNETGDF